MTFLFCIVLEKKHNEKTVVLKKNIDENEVLEIIDKKKPSLFKSLLSRTKS